LRHQRNFIRDVCDEQHRDFRVAIPDLVDDGLLLCPGSMLLDYFLGVSNSALVIAVFFFSALGFLLLTILAAFARDSQRQTGLRQAPSQMSGRPVSQASS
jgi:hypothetical protein